MRFLISRSPEAWPAEGPGPCQPKARALPAEGPGPCQPQLIRVRGIFFFESLIFSRSGLLDTWKVLLCIFQHVDLLIFKFRKTDTCLELIFFVGFQGSPSPLRLCRSCRRSSFFSWKARYWYVWSMYLVDLSIFVDFRYLDLCFWCLDLSMWIAQGCKKVPGQPFCEHANCERFAPDGEYRI